MAYITGEEELAVLFYAAALSAVLLRMARSWSHLQGDHCESCFYHNYQPNPYTVMHIRKPLLFCNLYIPLLTPLCAIKGLQRMTTGWFYILKGKQRRFQCV